MPIFVTARSIQDFFQQDAIQERLKLHIIEIVDRYRTAGEVLTWRIIHAIDDEAFEELADTDAFDEYQLGVFQHLNISITYPADDTPVDLLELDVLPMTFKLIIDAYSITH